MISVPSQLRLMLMRIVDVVMALQLALKQEAVDGEEAALGQNLQDARDELKQQVR